MDIVYSLQCGKTIHLPALQSVGVYVIGWKTKAPKIRTDVWWFWWGVWEKARRPGYPEGFETWHLCGFATSKIKETIQNRYVRVVPGCGILAHEVTHVTSTLRRAQSTVHYTNAMPLLMPNKTHNVTKQYKAHQKSSWQRQVHIGFILF